VIIRPMKHLLLPLLAAGLTLAVGASLCVGATSASLQISFGTTPHWARISGTRVEEIRTGDRPNYDMFRYGGDYYVYNNDQWYTSTRERGQFNAIDDRLVPGTFAGIPRDHWRNYPSAWNNRDNSGRFRGSSGPTGFLQINLGSRPRWSGVSGTSVRVIGRSQYPDYDVFHYGGSYYAYSNGHWYMSRRSNGRYNMIDDRSVPGAFTRIPEHQWHNYPSAWKDQNGTSRYDTRNQRRQRGQTAHPASGPYNK
jgi:hypothetical protein